ncbi:protein rep [Intestinibacter bartlettii]|jgi:plasmid rolling circle replication initiator protein Rep|uniref:protein rep n=1 Tax=Intestinibacter bartlettii TaxID=261299 RepID=UPI002431A793|nr:protein rep [Intestinibacter bartlettii]
MEQLNKQVEFLEDKSFSCKVRDWSGKKKRNLSLSEIYMMIKESYRKIHSEKFNRFFNREERSRMCATVLQFKKDTEQKRKLHQAYFCQLRLCPVCNWRRSLKIFSQVSKIIQAIEQDREHAYIFLTLTQKNVSGEELDQELDKMMKAWNRFLGYKKVKDVVKGSYRGLEITYDKESKITKRMYQEKKDYYKKLGLKVGNKNPNFDMYHPHFHVLIVVRKGYFTSKEYLSHEVWRELWAKAMRLDYLPQVNVKRVKGNTAEAVAETAKYVAKDSDYVIEKDLDLSMNVVETLDYALERRRLVSFSGIMKEWHKKLNLDDTEDGDLVHIDSEKDEELEGEMTLETYAWNVGYMNYVRV